MNHISLVSICIPAYNASRFIGETLESVRKQTYRDWELIVVEDGSMDGTREIVEEFRKQVHQKVTYIRSEKNLGLTATRNIAAKASVGNWVAMLDSDDLWEESHLSDLINTTSTHPDCDLIHSGSILFDSQSGKIKSERFPDAEAIREFPISLFKRNYIIQPSSVMVSRKLLEKIGGSNESFKYAEDMEMWFRCARMGFKFAYSGKNTCWYRKHTGALTARVLETTLEIAKIYDANADWMMIPKSVRLKYASGIWLAAARISRRSNSQLAILYFSNSVKYHFSYKHLFYWLVLKSTFLFRRQSI